MNDAEVLELARLIHATQRRLHRYCVSRFEEDANSVSPSPALTLPQVNMIMTVREADCLTVKQLAEALHVKAPAVSAMVDRLVEMDVLTRTANPVDRREVLIRVSPKHEAWIMELEQRNLQAFVELAEKVGLSYAPSWRRLSRRLQEVFDDLQSPDPSDTETGNHS
ncbi:MAG TPA: MarR family transcriptional regulator [Candidatus Hydrogenedentes bacterium]|nr:MarR family transcriptional regulator [Candidatus Hydrogenedentota bacterium]HPG68203.1 MarR family transcriptional regulator [Candidatus Hydrogenedentota bacterium]